jgi:hypothetical protein
MYKKVFILLFVILVSNLNANKLFDKIENLIGGEQFKVHNKLIHLVFKNQQEFYINSEYLNYKHILQTLKENGLLKLRFKNPTDLTIEFTTNADQIKSLKILNETLKAMGYYYYFTKQAIFNKSTNILQWTITFKAEYMLDPLLLVKELRTQSCHIMNIEKKNDTYWKYELDVKNSKLKNTIKVDHNEKVVLQKPLQPYFIEINNATKLQIIGRTLNHWFPYIVFYDEHLNVLKTVKKKRVYRGYRTNIPHRTKYIKITDLYTLVNIKRGLSIIVK